MTEPPDPCCDAPDLRIESKRLRDDCKLDLVIVCKSCRAKFLLAGAYPIRAVFDIESSAGECEIVAHDVEPTGDGKFRHHITIDTRAKP